MTRLPLPARGVRRLGSPTQQFANLLFCQRFATRKGLQMSCIPTNEFFELSYIGNSDGVTTEAGPEFSLNLVLTIV